VNTLRIIQAVKQIEDNAKALKWLEEFGPQFHGRNDADAVVKVHLNLASACPGAVEAAAVLSAFARLSLPEIIDQATRNCRNTIEIAESAIREEATPPEQRAAS
jgi:hypothetical protein